MSHSSRKFSDLPSLLDAMTTDTGRWHNDGFARPWFRGHEDAQYKLEPSVLRCGHLKREFDFTKKFRLMAPGFGPTPDTGRIDQWLFLMQHHGLPTRLLDWTESMLTAVFFATQKARKEGDADQDAAVFALNPTELNRVSGLWSKQDQALFPNTWVQGRTLQTIKIAFGTADESVGGKEIRPFKKPTAIFPSGVHPRVTAQKSCFTLHGKDDRPMEDILLEDGSHDVVLRKYILDRGSVCEISNSLASLGVTQTAVFPDLDGLAKDIKHSFGYFA